MHWLEYWWHCVHPVQTGPGVYLLWPGDQLVHSQDDLHSVGTNVSDISSYSWEKARIHVASM